MLPPAWISTPVASAAATALRSKLDLHPVLVDLLVQRGIETPEEAEAFFNPHWEDLHDPFLLKDMDKAVARLDQALSRGEKILIYGDYDVDGTMSVSFLYQFLLNQGHRELYYYLPDRYKEGYGLSDEGVAYAREHGVSLMITVDCGIRAQAQIDNARSQGMDVIICDHHLPGEEWPFATAVLDPQRPDCDYPNKYLSGCGVAFKLAQGWLHYRGKSDQELQGLTDFVAISIACDVMPITGENRTLTYFGMQELNTTRKNGLRALIRVSNRKKPLSVSDLVFGIGPIINAAGRMADADLVVKLMLAANRQVAKEHAEALRQRNELRKEYDKRTADEAREEVKEYPDWEKRKSLVLCQPHWHKGVIGIVAARLSVDFHRPTVVLTQADDMLVGSARSNGTVNLFEAIEACEDLLESYGGHVHAAGMSLLPEHLEEFRTRFEAVIQTTMPDDGLQPTIHIAAELPLAEVTPEFYRTLRRFSPFGPSNRKPIFVSTRVRAQNLQLLKGEHLRFLAQQEDGPVVPAIAFGKGAFYDAIRHSETFTICYTLEENRWGGKTHLQLMIKDFDVDGSKWGKEGSTT
ncbi:MAG: single-stranded-DNA-specific exonuclease RecJ [Bacteroidetes bacterium]|nr:MAG: single-stranded-DNA-specific exonuclease RecJ [Bacteroidota bacterium]